MRPFAVLVTVLVIAASGARGAAPAWAMACVRTPAPPGEPIVLLKQEMSVEYLDADHTQRQMRYAVRLQNDSARPRATVGARYNADTDRIVSANAWILAPDGSTLKTYRRKDFLDVSIGSNAIIWNSERVISFAGGDKLRSGDILAVEIETEQPSGIFEVTDRFSTAIYTVDSRLEVSPPPGRSLVWFATSADVPEPRPGPVPGSLCWDDGPIDRTLTGGRPLGFHANPQAVRVRVAPLAAPLDWAEAARFANTIMSPRIEESAAVRAEAAELVSGQRRRWDRIRAVAAFVQKQIAYLSLTDDTDTFAGMRPHPSGEVLANRYGDCKDKAALLVAMLRAIGEDGRILILFGGNPAAIDPHWPTLGFNHAIAAIPADADAPPDWPRIDGGKLGPLVVFDPTDAVTPLGVLSASDQGGWALLIDGTQGNLVRLPAAEGPRHFVAENVDASLDATGEIAVSDDEESSGLPAATRYGVRSNIRGEALVGRWLAFVRQGAPLAHDLVGHDDWQPESAIYRRHLEYHADRYGRDIGAGLMAVCPQILPGVPEFPRWQTKAEGKSWLWTGNLRLHVRLKIPEGFAVEELPDNWDHKGATVDSHLHYVAANGVITYDSLFSIKPGFYDQDQYEKIRVFIDKLRDAERQPVLLRRTAHS